MRLWSLVLPTIIIVSGKRPRHHAQKRIMVGTLKTPLSGSIRKRVRLCSCNFNDLIYSLMLESHNDSAVAIAEHVGGSVEGFAALMNQKAEEIGCEHT